MKPLRQKLPEHPRQLNMILDSVSLRGMSPSERRTVLAQLANLLIEAAGGRAEDRDHDEC